MTATGAHPGIAARRRRARRRALATAAAIAAAGLLGFALGAHALWERRTLPVIRRAPDYTLTNQLGQRVSSASFRGKVQIVSFLFPYCTTMCPLIAAHLANFENLDLRPAGLADKVEIVAFNIDPSGVGPRQMRAFLKEYGWNPGDLRWQYLTGSPGEIRRVVRRGFAVAYKRVALRSEEGGAAPLVAQPEIVNKLAEAAHPDYDIMHDDVIEVVDQRGRIRKIYENADTLGARRLLGVVEALLREPHS